MPSLEPSDPPSGPVVTGFTASGYVCGDARFSGGLWLTPSRAEAWDAPPLDNLAARDIADLVGIDPVPEFLLFGTGAEMRWPPASLHNDLDAQGIGIEAMDSRAAAKAWGVLRREGRWIVAALLPLDRV